MELVRNFEIVLYVWFKIWNKKNVSNLPSRNPGTCATGKNLQNQSIPIDHIDIFGKFHPVFKRIDHQPLFELDLLEDGDCISVAKWIRNETIKILPQLSRVEVYEKEGCGVILDWKNNDLYLPE